MHVACQVLDLCSTCCILVILCWHSCHSVLACANDALRLSVKLSSDVYCLTGLNSVPNIYTGNKLASVYTVYAGYLLYLQGVHGAFHCQQHSRHR